ncbi:hypothetical protein AgCh_004951 [Apium graveolens]
MFLKGQGDASGRSKQSRSEEKSRKAMLKLGMKPIPGVICVTVKKSKNEANGGKHHAKRTSQMDKHPWYKRVPLLDSLLDYAGSDGFHSLP